MSLYAQYVFEREGLTVISTGDAFLSYKFREKECFLQDIFVAKEKRMTSIGRQMLQQLFDIAIANGSNVVTANIYTKDPNANDTLKAALACGFKIISSGNNVLLIAKELGGI